MMPESIRAGLLFLINTLFDIYLFALIVRIILVYIGSNYFDPLTQFIVKLTDSVVKPIRRFIPNVRRLELSSMVLVLTLELIKFLLISFLSFGFPDILGLFMLAIFDSIKLVIETFFYAILLQAILSWFQPNSPMNFTLAKITAPIMRPLHRVIPNIGGIDITPIPAMIILQLLIIVIINPLMAFSMGVAFG